MPVPRRFDRQPPERDTTRVNERIRVPEVRVIDEKGDQIGIMKTPDALRYAQERDLDLVEVAPEAKPPVCRILDYSKYKYEQAQKQKAARKHQQQIVVREIKLRPKIAQHDYDTKKGHVVRFLNHKDKVKVTIMFRGREMAHPERGVMLLNRLVEDLGEIAVVDQRPQQDGRNMTMLLSPSRSILAREDEQGVGEHDAAPDKASAKSTRRSRRADDAAEAKASTTKKKPAAKKPAEPEAETAEAPAEDTAAAPEADEAAAPADGKAAAPKAEKPAAPKAEKPAAPKKAAKPKAEKPAAPKAGKPAAPKADKAAAPDPAPAE